MWQKFDDEVEVRRPASTPMLETNIEALSEFSLVDEFKSNIYCSLKKHEKICTAILVMLILLVPIILLLIVLEVRRYQLTEPEALPIADGSLHLAVTSCGLVEGIAKDGGFKFQGIPYSTPPVGGENRWKPGKVATRLEECWEGVRTYHKNQPRECLQVEQPNQGDFKITGDEDCLTLDIYTPHIGYDNPSPVVIVIAVPSLVGGWPDGSFRDQATPTAKLARDKDVVFVVPRFRLGPLGFLPQLLANNTESIVSNISNFTESIVKAQKAQIDLEKSHNLGITDLMAALVWVQLNIEHFGGDHRVVTLLGWGAGATLVSSLTTIPPPKGHSFLFTQVWITGGGNAMEATKMKNYEEGLKLWIRSPCNSSQYDPFCLLSLPGKELMKSIPPSWINWPGKVWLQPDHFWFERPADLAWADLKPPEGKDFPLVVGVTADGAVGVDSRCLEMESKVEAGTKDLMSRLDQNMLNKVQISYDNMSSIHSKLALLTDSQLICPLWRLARTADRYFSSGVFFYVASHRRARQCDGNPTLVQLADGLSDLSAILGRYGIENPSDAAFVSQVQSLFYGFLSDGVLAGEVRAGRGLYEVGADEIRSKMSHPMCDLWNSVPAEPFVKRF